MEFSVKKYDLLEELNLTQGLSEAQDHDSILGNILCEAEGDQVSADGHRP